MKRFFLPIATCVVIALALAVSAGADVKVTDRAYVRHDGGTDVTIQSCSSDFTDTTADAPTPTPANDEGGGERQQNESTAAVNPSNPMQMTGGSNDYCALPTTTDAYAGFYYSSDGGASWTDSLLPGYPTDTSAEGSDCSISPQHCLVINSGDPVQAWDNWGHLFYGVLGFNRARPGNGSIFAARYDWPDDAAAPDYRWTALVKRGTPSQPFAGVFNDKVQLEVDRGVNSPYAGNASRPWGNVYVCWARFTGVAGNNGVFFSRSTDGGHTYSEAQKISDSIHGSQFCDIAVTSDGTVFVAWRSFSGRGAQQRDAVVWAKSTNGGATFTKPATATGFIHWDVGDGSSRDCGDGPSACESGYVFFREDSQVRITADPTDAAHPQAAYVVFNATVPGTQTPTGSSYGTVEPGIGSHGQLYFTTTLNGGTGWTAPARITPGRTVGHQFFPDIDANAGQLHVVWQDSEDDTATGPPDTPSGGDFRTVPIANRWVEDNPPGGVSVGAGIGVETQYATSGDLGATWSTPETVSSASQMPQYEQFGNRDVPFFGDYNYISAVGTTVFMTWTDQRDPAETKPGTDPRYTNGDGTDGFDVHQCRLQSADGSWSADNCPNAGGLDQNIFGAIVH
jgi:hypothetical protein